MGKQVWGDQAPRLRQGPGVWHQPDAWDRKAVKTGVPIKVFCMSMGDFFENHPDVAPWRAEAWPIIKRTKHLRWQILTKRSSLIDKMLPDDWGPDYAHVGFMCTVVNQMEANRDVPRLLKLKHDRNVTWVGLSVEPMLAGVDLAPWLPSPHACTGCEPGAKCEPATAADERPTLDWVIVGGESAKGAKALAKCRSYHMEAALTLIRQCRTAHTAVFHKQLGSLPTYNGAPFKVDHWKGEIPDQWPDAWRVQEFPQALLH